MRKWAVALLFLGACGKAPKTPEKGVPTTKYRVGDFVAYQYIGDFSAEPVTLREQVMAQEGNRLRIDVTAQRGKEVRQWVQVVTDTPDNEKSNAVDALYEMRNGTYQRLSNEQNRELLRLYEWVLIDPDEEMSEVTSEPCDVELVGQRFTCTCMEGVNRYKGRPVVALDTDCPDFLWTHGPGGFRYAENGDPVLEVDVVEFGRQANVTPLPFDPTKK